MPRGKQDRNNSYKFVNTKLLNAKLYYRIFIPIIIISPNMKITNTTTKHKPTNKRIILDISVDGNFLYFTHQPQQHCILCNQ